MNDALSRVDVSVFLYCLCMCVCARARELASTPQCVETHRRARTKRNEDRETKEQDEKIVHTLLIDESG